MMMTPSTVLIDEAINHVVLGERTDGVGCAPAEWGSLVADKSNQEYFFLFYFLELVSWSSEGANWHGTHQPEG